MNKHDVNQSRVKEAEKQLQLLQKQVDYDTKDYTLELLLSKFNSHDFFIPDYQRKYVWKTKHKSLFIESVLLGLPIPFMFFADCEDGRLEIIDGAQRMQTLNEFVHGNMKLATLEKLTLFRGISFLDLSEPLRRKLLNRTFRVVVLDESTRADVRQDLFNRINTSGVKASDSEIRRGSYPGPLTSFIEECTHNKKFISLCPVSSCKSIRQERFELVLRFFAYLYNYQNFKHNVNTFLNKFLESNLKSFDKSKYQHDFEMMLDFVDNNFPNGFAKIENATTTPRVRFEALSVGTALALKENPFLKIEGIAWINSEKFQQYTTSDASNNSGRLRMRIEYVRDCLLGKEVC